MDDVLLRPIEEGDVAWLVEEHVRDYREAQGFDASFGTLVEQIVRDFLARGYHAKEAGWIAARGPERLGCIFCMAGDDPGVAKLRIFYLVPAARGLGLGKRLIEACIAFGRAAGYREMVLWTHASQAAAGVLYAKSGFRRVEGRAAHNFGVDVIEEIWSCAL